MRPHIIARKPHMYTPSYKNRLTIWVEAPEDISGRGLQDTYLNMTFSDVSEYSWISDLRDALGLGKDEKALVGFISNVGADNIVDRSEADALIGEMISAAFDEARSRGARGVLVGYETIGKRLALENGFRAQFQGMFLKIINNPDRSVAENPVPVMKHGMSDTGVKGQFQQSIYAIFFDGHRKRGGNPHPAQIKRIQATLGRVIFRAEEDLVSAGDPHSEVILETFPVKALWVDDVHPGPLMERLNTAFGEIIPRDATLSIADVNFHESEVASVLLQAAVQEALDEGAYGIYSPVPESSKLNWKKFFISSGFSEAGGYLRGKYFAIKFKEERQ